jgi:hypothetical protein
MMMPDSTGGGRILETRGSVIQRLEEIDELIPEEFLKRRSYKKTTLPTSRERLTGRVIIQEEKQALKEAKRKREGLVFWTDGSRRDDEWVGCAVVWEKERRWEKRRVHLG